MVHIKAIEKDDLHPPLRAGGQKACKGKTAWQAPNRPLHETREFVPETVYSVEYKGFVVSKVRA